MCPVVVSPLARKISVPLLCPSSVGCSSGVPSGACCDPPCCLLLQKWQRRFFILYEHGLLRYALDEMVSAAGWRCAAMFNLWGSARATSAALGGASGDAPGTAWGGFC